MGDAQAEVSASDFVAIDFGSKARDILLTLYPQLRDAKLRTNSLTLALNNLYAEGGIAVLPEDAFVHLPAQTPITKIQSLENISLKVYLHTMKQVRRVGLQGLIDGISSINPA